MERERNLFERFGGVRPMAEALHEAPSTVQSWKTAGRIPSTKQPDVLSRAGEIGVCITAHDVVFPLNRRLDQPSLADLVVSEADRVACDNISISHQEPRR